MRSVRQQTGSYLSSGQREVPVRGGPGALILSLALAVAALLAQISYHGGLLPAEVANRILAAISMLHGAWVFVIHGRERISASGLFMLASSLFVGVGGLMVNNDPYLITIADPHHYLNAALFAGTLTQIGIGTASWIQGSLETPLPVTLDDSFMRRLQATGLIVMVAVHLVGDRLGPFFEGFAFSGALMVSGATLMSRRGIRNVADVLLLISPPVLYAIGYHDGTGRLRVVTLFVAITLIYFARYGRIWKKLIVLLSMPVIVAVLGMWRINFEASEFGSSGSGTGLSSMLASIGVFALVIHAFQEGWVPSFGASFLSPIRAALPEGLGPFWIPDALGYQLVEIVQPDRIGTGFSTVASVYGEWWWNFSAAGLLLAIPVLSTLLMWLDRTFIRSFRQSGTSPQRFLIFIFMATLIGGIGDLVWSGSHTWIVRMYARGTLFGIIAFVAVVNPTPHGGRIKRGARARYEAKSTRTSQ